MSSCIHLKTACLESSDSLTPFQVVKMNTPSPVNKRKRGDAETEEAKGRLIFRFGSSTLI